MHFNVPNGALRFAGYVPLTRSGRLFTTFWQGGFECSTHTVKTGRRLDLVSATGHNQFVEKDYVRLKALGIQTVREGLRWHLIEASRGQYDFSSALPMVTAAKRHGIQIIWDLVHFGWPDHLDIFEPRWVEALGEFASAAAKFLSAGSNGEPLFIAPVNEISFLSWAGGDKAYINPFATCRGGELKRQLVRGALLASDVLMREIPGVRLVAPEPVIHIVGDPNRPDDVRSAAEYESSMFEAWDMLSGRAQPELGGSEAHLDVIGINYYDRNQWWNFGEPIRRNEPEYRPFREILQEVYERYRRPLFIAETGTEDDDRPAWLAYIAGEVRGAIASGVPVHGICLYPILNHPGWEDDRHCYNGLFDYAQTDGEREIYQPLAEEIERQKLYGETS